MELLIVVLIIGIVAAVALPQYQVAVAKSRLVEGFSLAKSIQEAEELYWLEHGEYTTNLSDLHITVKPTHRTTVEDFSRNFLPDGYVVAIAVNAYGYIEDRVEVYTDDTLSKGISFYFEHAKPTSFAMAGKRVCFGNNSVYYKACLSMGGRYSHSSGSGNTQYYLLP